MSECGLVQLNKTAPPDSMYKTIEYGYKSSISNTMRNHLRLYNEEFALKSLSKDSVLDIGSNDATFLKYYSDNIKRIGVDPTGEQFKDCYSNTNIGLIPDYFTDKVFKERYGDIKCDVVSSICMFYDLPDPVEFAKHVNSILKDDGIWTCEQSYLLTMLKTNSLDTICHEHLEYYCLTPVKKIADIAGLKIIDIKFNSSNGGSFRIYFCKKTCDKYEECTELINQVLMEEDNYNVRDISTYKNFVNSCNSELKKLTDFIKIINDNNQSAYIYGASTKGNCVLQHCNITEDLVKYAVERNPEKIGRSTITGIEIISEERMRKNPPEFLIVLPWHFKKEIIKREEEYLNNGGQLIFYFPTFEIVSNKPKTLITGCDGFIGSYIKKEFLNHNLYGIAKTRKTDETKIVKNIFDMNNNNFNDLRHFIEIVNPDNVIHLASIASSTQAFTNPFETLQNNGMLCAKLCEIIADLSNKQEKSIRLFNASSSEIYKGHGTYNVEENETSLNNTNHLHPYSIAKIMSNQIIQFYRNEYGLNFSNGVIFTTQSNKKSSKFLLNKMSNHIKEWNSNEKNVLHIGPIESYRNIIHPSDVSTAIKTILEQDEGSDYLICNYTSNKISDLVKILYKNANIELVKGEIDNNNN